MVLNNFITIYRLLSYMTSKTTTIHTKQTQYNLINHKPLLHCKMWTFSTPLKVCKKGHSFSSIHTQCLLRITGFNMFNYRSVDMTTLATKSGHIYILPAWCYILISKVEQDGLIGSGLLMLEAGKLTIRHQLLAKVYLQRRDVGSRHTIDGGF